MIVKEEINDIDIDDIGNLEDLLRILFIHEECGNLKVSVDGGELNRIINEKKKPGVLQTYRCPLCDKYFMREYVLCEKCFFGNNHVEYYESV